MSSRGKEFEKLIKKALNAVPDSFTLRLNDSFGFTDNPSDFIFFKSGILYLIEVKSHENNTFPLKAISDNQWKYLNTQVSNIKSYVIIWFIDHDITRMFDFTYLLKAKMNDIKSIKYDDENGIIIPARKKRMYFEYDIQTLFP